MANEEKAKEIANRHTYVYDDIEYSDVVDACEEMAKWKDQQFKEYLEKKVEEQREIIDSSRAFNIGAVLTRDVYQEIIDELFEED